MTLIELLVALAIFATILGVIAWNFDSYRDNDILRRTALQFATDLRLVQTMSMSGQATIDPAHSTLPPSMPPGGYGIHVSGTENDYSVFADRGQFTTACINVRDGRFDQVNNCDNIVSPGTIHLSNQVVVESIAVSGVAVNNADIAFLPPKPIPYVGSGVLTNPATMGQTVVITFKHTKTNRLRQVTLIGATGQVSIKAL